MRRKKEERSGIRQGWFQRGLISYAEDLGLPFNQVAAATRHPRWTGRPNRSSARVARGWTTSRAPLKGEAGKRRKESR